MLGALLSLTPLATPALALAAGIALALTIGNPWPALTNLFSGRLLQVSIVGLGFGIPLGSIVSTGSTGVLYTVALLVGVFAVGLALARWMAVDRTLALLVTAGTGICGGSAIAALGPALGARREAMSVALATVFVLNGVALYAFPPIGHLFGLSQHQFGVWAALAIHDTSSVVGAAASYGAVALNEATILKLSRALWIIPIVLIVPAIVRRGAGHEPVGSASARGPLPIPWFIVAFVLASVFRALAPADALPWFDAVSRSARTALVLTLFLIGAGLSRAQLREVGVRPFVHGTLLWIAVSAATLTAVRWGIV